MTTKLLPRCPEGTTEGNRQGYFFFPGNDKAKKKVFYTHFTVAENETKSLRASVRYSFDVTAF